jgi:hypothetical protein
LQRTGQLDVAEPFAGLFTQGMVTHESYQGEDGRWLYPAEVEKLADGTARHLVTGEAVTIGRGEKMSKSKMNTVDPAGIIERYGADTARWFVLSDNPPERDIEWTEAGVAGASRFTQRVYRLAQAIARTPDDNAPPGAEATALTRATHRTIAAENDCDLQIRETRKIANGRFHLRGEFAGGFQHEKARARIVVTHLHQNGQSERRCLAGAGLGAADDILSVEDERNGAELDGGWVHVSHGFDPFQNRTRQTKLGKWHTYNLCVGRRNVYEGIGRQKEA